MKIRFRMDFHLMVAHASMFTRGIFVHGVKNLVEIAKFYSENCQGAIAEDI